MCCFSQPVISVSATNIFARAGAEGRQFLVYSMSLKAKSDLAMILPLPVKMPAGEKDVQFIDLKGDAEVFDHLRSGFPLPRAPRNLSPAGARIAGEAILEDVKGGGLEAFFVP